MQHSKFCHLHAFETGHSQQEHETSHGSMSKTRWAIEDADAVIELNGRKFGSDDDGAPMMCSLICQDMGRHVHIDNCRANSQGACNASDVQHIQTRINPNPDQPKDWITHDLFWRRSGENRALSIKMFANGVAVIS